MALITSGVNGGANIRGSVRAKSLVICRLSFVILLKQPLDANGFLVTP